jgi:hypothetical protein
MGAREMDIMDSTGHTKHIWDAEKPEEVVAARELYNSLTKKGYRAFHVKKDGEEGKQMSGFDAEAEKMILIPPIVGG